LDQREGAGGQFVMGRGVFRFTQLRKEEEKKKKQIGQHRDLSGKGKKKMGETD